MFYKGIRSGMFRSKRGFKENEDEKDIFIFRNLAVGVKISIDNFKFLITDIDDKTLKFMIDNSNEVNNRIKNFQINKKKYYI